MLAAAALFAAACDYSEENLGVLRVRSAYDMQCQESEMKLEPLAIGTVGVSGCGRRVTYVCANQSRDYGEPGCTWVADASSQ